MSVVKLAFVLSYVCNHPTQLVLLKLTTLQMIELFVGWRVGKTNIRGGLVGVVGWTFVY